MKTILLGQIPDDFSPEKYIPLSPACFKDKEDVYAGWENLDFDFNLTVAEITEIDKKTTDYTLWLINKKVDYFNQLIGEKYSFTFWKTVFFPYFNYLIQSFYLRQLRILALIEKYKDTALNIRLVKKAQIQPIEKTIDFVYLLLNVHFNEFLFSEMIKNNIPDNWQVVTKEYKEAIIEQTPKVKKGFLQKVETIFYSNLKRYHKIYGLNLWEHILFCRKINTIKTKLPKIKYDLASIKSSVDWIFDFDELFEVLTLNYVKKQVEIIKNTPLNFEKNRIRLGSQMLVHGEEIKIENALAIEHGEYLIGVQHGGHNYGSAKYFSIANEMEFKQNIFISWGWQQQEDLQGFITPLPSPLLSKFANKHFQKNNQIMLVGTQARLYWFRINSGPIPEKWLEYRLRKKELMLKLNDNVKENFFYRPYLHKRGAFDDERYYRKDIPDLKLIAGDLHALILNCKLLVLDHPGTTLNIAYAANIPTICFWKKDFFPFCRQAEKYFEELENAGLLFRGDDYIEKTVDLINSISRNVQDWWQQPQIQQAKNNWRNQYALTDKNWKKQWFDFFNELKQKNG